MLEDIQNKGIVSSCSEDGHFRLLLPVTRAGRAWVPTGPAVAGTFHSLRLLLTVKKIGGR